MHDYGTRGRTRIDGENEQMQRDLSPHRQHENRIRALERKVEREGESACTMDGDAGSPLICTDSRGHRRL